MCLKMIFSPLAKDAYKIGHVFQYPEGTEYVYTNCTARSGKHSNVKEYIDGVIFVGLQRAIMKYLIDDWENTFFNQHKDIAISQYRERVKQVLGFTVPTDHLEDLWDIGYLPLEIRALPEGSYVPYGIPLFTIVNTHPRFGWLTNMIESALSAETWLSINSATTSFVLRRIVKEKLEATSDNTWMVDYQLHDFSFRGMANIEAAATSGFSHLAVGNKGTDTIPALDVAMDYYGAPVFEEIGVSVPATEHSVMCAGSKETESETFKRLITEVYPSGIVSIVSDTWDLWNVLDVTALEHKETILSRDGKVVFRPDSGEPLKILCGDPGANPTSPEYLGAIQILYKNFPGETNSKGYKTLDPHVGLIYGDGMSVGMIISILEEIEQMGFDTSCVVFGVGSYVFQFTTRDTHSLAFKSTNVVINGKSIPIFKDPVTGDGTKKSAIGLLKVVSDSHGNLELLENVSQKDIQEKDNQLSVVYKDGFMTRPITLQDIRNRTNSLLGINNE